MALAIYPITEVVLINIKRMVKVEVEQRPYSPGPQKQRLRWVQQAVQGLGDEAHLNI
jgi:hypothetical protein